MKLNIVFLHLLILVKVFADKGSTGTAGKPKSTVASNNDLRHGSVQQVSPAAPTGTHSDYPSDAPSDVPSDAPSGVPSIAASEFPSMVPSSVVALDIGVGGTEAVATSTASLTASCITFGNLGLVLLSMWFD